MDPVKNIHNLNILFRLGIYLLHLFQAILWLLYMAGDELGNGAHSGDGKNLVTSDRSYLVMTKRTPLFDTSMSYLGSLQCINLGTYFKKSGTAGNRNQDLRICNPPLCL